MSNIYKKKKKKTQANEQFTSWMESHTIKTYTNYKVLISKNLDWNRQKWYNVLNSRTPLKPAELISIETITKTKIFDND